MVSLKIYSLYFLQFLKAKAAYKADFWASIAASALISLSGLLFILVLMDGQSVTELNGWSRDEVLFIYGYSMIAMAIFSVFAPNLYNFGDRYVIQGNFDRVLLRPLNSLLQVLFESFAFESVGNLCVGLVVLFHAKHALGISFGVWDWTWLAASAVSGAVILISVFVFLSSLSFHFEDRMGIAPPVYNLINFGRYPLPIFNETIQFILRWVVPFAFVAFYPATHFLQRGEFAFFCYLTPVVAAATAAIAATAWRFGVSRYSSVGS